MMKTLLRAVGVTGALLASVPQIQAQPAPAVSVKIAEQPFPDALKALAQQMGIQLLVDAAVIPAAATAPALDGKFTPAEALDRMLAATGLTYEFVNDRTVRIAPARSAAQTISLTRDGKAIDGMTLAQNSSLAKAAHQDVSAQDEQQVAEQGRTERPLARDGNSQATSNEIVVTGSSIRGVVPPGSNLMVLDEKDIARSGAASVQDLFRTIPAQFSGGPSVQYDQRSGTGQSNPARGASLDLRGLGSDATLTLINGRRLAPSGDGSFVNVDAIPFSAVERVEILADGASATYGSDAIAGVVNIILKQKADGLDGKVRYAVPTQGGAEEAIASLSLGKSWDSGRFLLGAQFVDRQPLFNEERPYSQSCDLRNFGGTNFCTTFASPGNITSPAGLVGAIPTGQDGRTLTQGQLIVGAPNYFNSLPGTNSIAQRQQIGGFGSLHQRVTDRLGLFADFMLTDQKIANYSDAQLAALSVPTTNAYRQLNGLGLPGTAPISVQYSFINDVGNTLAHTDSTVYSLDGGAHFEFSDAWSVEFYALQGRDKTHTFYSNLIDTRTLANGGALQIALASSSLASAFNPFGDGGDNPASVIQSLLVSSGSSNDLKFNSYHLKLNGALFDASAGPVKLAAGVEYRQESFFTYSETNYTTGVPTGPTIRDGDRNVRAAFGELFVPVVGANRNFLGLRLLELSASVRTDKYADFGDTVNPKAGIRWSPVEGLVVRGSYGTSFKAPRLNDLLAPSSVQYLNATTAFGGIDRNNDGALSLVIVGGGSPNLKAEKGESYTVGLDLSPRFLPGFIARLTYYNVDIKDRIGSVSDLRAMLSNPAPYTGVVYFPLPDDALVARIVGNPARVIGVPFAPGGAEGLVITATANIAKVQTDGIDLDMRYPFVVEEGSLETSLRATYILGLQNQQNPGLPSIKAFDVVGRPVDLKIRAGATWAQGALQLSGFANYLSDYKNTAVTPYATIKSSVTFDAQAAYSVDERFGRFMADTRLSLSAINLFDKDPPFVNGGASAYDGTNYSVLGRVVSLELSKRF